MAYRLANAITPALASLGQPIAPSQCQGSAALRHCLPLTPLRRSRTWVKGLDNFLLIEGGNGRRLGQASVQHAHGMNER
jgi:hypothetical protein